MLLYLILIVGLISGDVLSDEEKNFTRSKFSPRKWRWSSTFISTTENSTTTATPTTTTPITTTTPTTTTPIATTTPTTTTLTATETTAPDTTTNAETTKTQAPITPLTTIGTPDQWPEKWSDWVEMKKLKVFHCGVEFGHFHPWIAILEHTNPDTPENLRQRRKTLSKGVLIHPQYVLTTVSSIHNAHPFWTVSSVRFGDAITQVSETVTATNNHTQTIPVDEVFMHKNKDIALIKLVNPVRLTDFVNPVCMPKNENYNFRELYFHVCKRTKAQGKKSSKAKVTLVPVSPLSPQDCHIIFTRNKAQFSRSEFCAWDEAGDTCTGDFGGPLIGKLNGAYHLIGLKSYAQSDTPLKEVNLPGVYSRVGVHLKWINQIIGEDGDNDMVQWIQM